MSASLREQVASAYLAGSCRFNALNAAAPYQDLQILRHAGIPILGPRPFMYLRETINDSDIGRLTSPNKVRFNAPTSNTSRVVQTSPYAHLFNREIGNAANNGRGAEVLRTYCTSVNTENGLMHVVETIPCAFISHIDPHLVGTDESKRNAVYRVLANGKGRRDELFIFEQALALRLVR